MPARPIVTRDCIERILPYFKEKYEKQIGVSLYPIEEDFNSVCLVPAIVDSGSLEELNNAGPFG